MEEKSIPQRSNTSTKRLAWTALALILITMFLSMFVYVGTIATMKATQLVYVCFIALWTALALACLLKIVLKRVVFSNGKTLIVAIITILLGSSYIKVIIDTWNTGLGRQESTHRAKCAYGPRIIDKAMYAYAEDHYAKDHEYEYPPQDTWRQILIEEGYIGKNELSCFICPSIGGDPEKETSYIYRKPVYFEGNAPVLYDRKNNHSYPAEDSSRGRNVIGGAHGVVFLTEKEFQEQIRKDNARRQEMGLLPIPADD